MGLLPWYSGTLVFDRIFNFTELFSLFAYKRAAVNTSWIVYFFPHSLLAPLCATAIIVSLCRAHSLPSKKVCCSSVVLQVWSVNLGTVRHVKFLSPMLDLVNQKLWGGAQQSVPR